MIHSLSKSLNKKGSISMLIFPHVKNPHIYLFGAGGTGGFALEFLTRLFSTSKQTVTIDIYDGDDVEAKNLKRQNFTVDDLDLKKVTALIRRLEKQVINPPKFVEHTEYVVDADELMSEILVSTEDDETAIIVLAVDNIATRRLINETIALLEDVIPVIALDSGNDNQGGQVVVYANTEVSNTQLLGDATQVRLKTMLQIYPEIDIIRDDRDENPGIVSYCAEESESKPQAMMANVRNGELLASLVYQLSQNQPLPYNVWTSDIITGGTSGSLRINE